jgi:hypothetical protein
MKRAIFFVLLLAWELASFSQNLVINPGFEVWEKTNKPFGWTISQNCLKDSTNLNSGSYSCQHVGGTPSKWLGQTITIVSGNQYRLSFFYKTVITSDGSGCRIWCEWQDAARTRIYDALTDDIIRAKYMKSDTWQLYSIDITAPANACYFYLEVRTYQNSIAFWDDFVFAENVATNDFEEKLSDIMVYPNPAHDYLIISNLQNLQHIDIQYFTGINVFSSDFHNEKSVTIPVSGLPEGLYIIRIRTSDKLIIRKFIRKSE